MKEKILKILQENSYDITDQAGNQLIVVDDFSWEEVVEKINKLYKGLDFYCVGNDLINKSCKNQCLGCKIEEKQESK